VNLRLKLGKIGLLQVIIDSVSAPDLEDPCPAEALRQCRLFCYQNIFFFFHFIEEKNIDKKNLKYKPFFGTTNYNNIEAGIRHISIRH